jgi:hypothetical protein
MLDLEIWIRCSKRHAAAWSRRLVVWDRGLRDDAQGDPFEWGMADAIRRHVWK